MGISMYLLSSPHLSTLYSNATYTDTPPSHPGGGMPTSTNRTKWPVKGGAIAIQPGWFQGHAYAFFYVNLGLGEIPINMSLPMVPPFQVVGPTRDPYPGTFCLPQVSTPQNVTVNVGDKATIQIIETAAHGAALYNVCLHTHSLSFSTILPTRQQEHHPIPLH
jgi:hypothetical protein